MKKFTVEINVGDEIYVGINVTTKIKAIEFDDLTVQSDEQRKEKSF